MRGNVGDGTAAEKKTFVSVSLLSSHRFPVISSLRDSTHARSTSFTHSLARLVSKKRKTVARCH